MTTLLQHLTLALLFTLVIWPQEQISIFLVCWELGTDCVGGNNAQTPGPGYNIIQLYNFHVLTIIAPVCHAAAAATPSQINIS